MNETLATEWSWPIHRDAYDSTMALSEEEISFLTGEPVGRTNYSGPRWPALLPVRRLIEPLEDVFLYIDVAKQKRDQLIPILLRKIGKRHVSFWGWTDQDWLDVAAAHRYFTGWIIEHHSDPGSLQKGWRAGLRHPRANHQSSSPQYDRLSVYSTPVSR